MPTQSVLFVLVLLLGCAAGANVIVEWNTLALDVIRVCGIAPPPAARVLAMMHRAILDALNRLNCNHRGASSCNPRAASIAVSAAAHRVLGNSFISQYDLLDKKYASIIASLSPPELKPTDVAAVKCGDDAALKEIRERDNDGSLNFVPYQSQNVPGRWVPTPPDFARALLPQWGQVIPFLIKNIASLNPAGPPAFDSPEYSAAWNEVKNIGSVTSATRTAEQTAIANFWAAGKGTATPPGMWNVIAADILSRKKQLTDLVGYAEVFMLLNVAQANAGIAAWAAKYKYDTWRPVTAIRSGLTQVPALPTDPTWTSLLKTPPFPEYLSGHSTFSSASARILGLIFGTDNITFTAQSDAPLSTPRTFNSVSAAAEEAGQSRIYGGIHFQFSNVDGLQMGKRIAEDVNRQWQFGSLHKRLNPTLLRTLLDSLESESVH